MSRTRFAPSLQPIVPPTDRWWNRITVGDGTTDGGVPDDVFYLSADSGVYAYDCRL